MVYIKSFILSGVFLTLCLVADHTKGDGKITSIDYETDCNGNSMCLKYGKDYQNDPLVVAAQEDNLSEVRNILREKGNFSLTKLDPDPYIANLKIAIGNYDRSYGIALAKAARNKSLDMSRELVAAGARVNVGSTVANASYADSIDTVRYMLSVGGNIYLPVGGTRLLPYSIIPHLEHYGYDTHSEFKSNYMTQLREEFRIAGFPGEYLYNETGFKTLIPESVVAEKSKQLVDGAASGNLEQVRSAVRAGASFIMYPEALYQAATEGYKDIVNYLVEAGASLSFDYDNYNENGDWDWQYGFVNNHHTLLRRVVREDNTLLLQDLIKAGIPLDGSEIFKITQVAVDGAAGGNVETLELLIEGGMPVNCSLYYAIESDNPFVTSYLLRTFRNDNFYKGCQELKTIYYSPLIFASVLGKRRALRALLRARYADRNVDINATFRQEPPYIGYNALMMSISHNQKNSVIELCRAGARLDDNMIDRMLNDNIPAAIKGARSKSPLFVIEKELSERKFRKMLGRNE